MPQPTTRCEFYTRSVRHAIFLRGEWLEQAGFIDGIQLKIRVMPACIVITTQDIRELWGCVEGLSVVPINRRKVAQWLKEFPGAIHNTCAEP
ncbi:SymE family type I addiction module toxin [Pantoea ananatis]|uniref:SymE family type I addiction module toxin n=1 Tax=Pantoea ananas TaxID=553 RepID=UPI00345E7A92